jgi:hypothetical protein
MENDNKRLTCQQVKQWDMVDYLNGLNIHPVRIRNNDYWYFSPVRIEKTPSFKINRRLNKWYDHGSGMGGNILDFLLLFWQCTVSELLVMLGGIPVAPALVKTNAGRAPEPGRITILKRDKITSYPLIQYLRKRRIDVSIANKYCEEIHYRTGGKNYFAIGIKNQSGGYELRSLYFKGSSAPKDITVIENGHYDVAIFEGFFDFLAFRTCRKRYNSEEIDYIILNSLSLFEKARPFIEQHRQYALYLNRDDAGQNCRAYAMALSRRYVDASWVYTGFKDYNEWWIKAWPPRENFHLLPDYLKHTRRG